MAPFFTLHLVSFGLVTPSHPPPKRSHGGGGGGGWRGFVGNRGKAHLSKVQHNYLSRRHCRQLPAYHTSELCQKTERKHGQISAQQHSRLVARGHHTKRSESCWQSTAPPAGSQSNWTVKIYKRAEI